METISLKLIVVLATVFTKDSIMVASINSICKLCWCSSTSITCEEANSSMSSFYSDESEEMQLLNVTYM